MSPRDDPQELIPLTPRWFHVLLALADGPENGYRIMLRVEQNSEGRVRISPGTLYEALHRMRERRLIDELDPKGTDADGRKQRYYRLSRWGRRVLRAEAERLAADVRLARAARMLGDDGGAG